MISENVKGACARPVGAWADMDHGMDVRVLLTSSLIAASMSILNKESCSKVHAGLERLENL